MPQVRHILLEFKDKSTFFGENVLMVMKYSDCLSTESGVGIGYYDSLYDKTGVMMVAWF